MSLLGSRQITGALPGQAPATNAADIFGRIEVGTLFDVDPPRQSRLLSTDAASAPRSETPCGPSHVIDSDASIGFPWCSLMS